MSQNVPKIGDLVRARGHGSLTYTVVGVGRYSYGGGLFVYVKNPKDGRMYCLPAGHWEFADTAGVPTDQTPEYNGQCPRCDAPAYHGFAAVECSARCCHETTPRNYETPADGAEQVTIPF